MKFIPMGEPTPVCKDCSTKQEYIIYSYDNFFKTIDITKINIWKCF